jgi:hypothetical protein
VPRVSRLSRRGRAASSPSSPVSENLNHPKKKGAPSFRVLCGKVGDAACLQRLYGLQIKSRPTWQLNRSLSPEPELVSSREQRPAELCSARTGGGACPHTQKDYFGARSRCQASRYPSSFPFCGRSFGVNSRFIRPTMSRIGSTNQLSSGTTWTTIKSISVGR